MFLKELELVGFKSFPEKTRLKFESGITAIVGPNGCGKSNIFDSIRWVLGEQSTKALRSVKMEDVIFNGSDGKPALNMAEVTLFFSNESRRLSFDQDEIEVCRRIFRSGESQYYLNKTPVRLKDVADLFMGTGIGAESYSLVEQGKIGLILSTRPEERRLIFDEASGITKYKVQKREALRKLEETEQNLLRVSDIISEVRREINSLERQANKARRYKQNFEELKTKEINLANLEIGEIDKQREGLSDKINTAQDKVDSFGLKIQDAEKGVALRLEKIKQLEKELSGSHDRLINIDNLINNNTQRIQLDRERIEELNNRIQNLNSQLEAAKNRISSARKNLEDFQKENHRLRESVQQKQNLLLERQKEHHQADADIKSSQAAIKQTKNHILDLLSVSSQLKNEIADLQAHLKSLILRKKRLDIEKIKTREERDSLNQTLSQHIDELNNINNELGRINDQRKERQEQLSFELNSQERLNQEIKDLENEMIALQSQKEFLEKLKLKYQGISQSLNAVVYLDSCPKDDLSGMLIRIKEPPSAINKQERTFNPHLKFKLSGEAKPMPLETKAITQRIEQIQSQISRKKEQGKSIQARIEELNQALQDLDRKASAQERLVSNKNIQIDNLTEQLNKINQEFEVVKLEIDDLDSQIKQLQDKQTQMEERLAQTEGEQKQKNETVASLENSIIEFRSKREKTLVDITQIKTEIENQNLRLAQQQETLALLEGAFKESQQLYNHHLDEIKQSESKIKQLSDESEKLKQASQEAQQESVELHKQQEVQRAEFRQLSKLQEEDRQEILKFNQSIDGLKKEIYEYQIQERELDFKQRSIRDRINQVYKTDLEIQAADRENLENDKQALTRQIAELKQKIDSLGTVNLIAIEEYEELKKRYDFLTQQENDLNQAKQSLNQAINKINRTTRQMFLETFKKIQLEFRNYFRMLFGGGEAQVFLSDESKPLESGIEIICRPTGKKLQNILALSGGEKALAAVALMFAVFKVKPAPFCVLDEIDAALDEVNIGRFGGILQDFSKASQFLVITHNKKTIANADVMYGITMQQAGISKIVSVKLS